MRCSTHDHMPGSPRYRVRRRGGDDRGAGNAESAAVAVLISDLQRLRWTLGARGWEPRVDVAQPVPKPRGDSKPYWLAQRTSVVAPAAIPPQKLGLPIWELGA